jgi:hypothetical protein
VLLPLRDGRMPNIGSLALQTLILQSKVRVFLAAGFCRNQLRTVMRYADIKRNGHPAMVN